MIGMQFREANVRMGGGEEKKVFSRMVASPGAQRNAGQNRDFFIIIFFLLSLEVGAIVREQGWRGTDNAMQVGVCKLNQQPGRGAQGRRREGTRAQEVLVK